MTTSKPWPYEVLRSTQIKQLIRDLEGLPEWLKEQERRFHEEQRFAEAVFGEALEKSGMLRKLGTPHSGKKGHES